MQARCSCRSYREVFLIPELPIEQAGFRRERGTRDHIANLRWMMEKAREHQRDLYSMCFIDYKKAFDCVDHKILWVILRDMGVPVHLTVLLLRRLYTNQEATVRTEFGETDNIDIGKGVRQGCILPPILFNIYQALTLDCGNHWPGGPVNQKIHWPPKKPTGPPKTCNEPNYFRGGNL